MTGHDTRSMVIASARTKFTGCRRCGAIFTVARATRQERRALKFGRA